MSLQVCHCGWSKVTTHHGLRTHQGKMGCMLKAARVADSEQQYMLANAGLTNTQIDIRLDVCTSFNIGTEYLHSEKSLHFCHCGWSKMTTYRGLRIHQGKMGCTPKGMKIPKKEQYDGKYEWEREVDEKKFQPTKKVVVKKEKLQEPPCNKICSSSAPTTATVKDECNSYFESSYHFFPRSPKSKAGHQPQDFSTLPQVNKSVQEHPTPRHLGTEKKIKRQTLSQIDSETMNRSCCTDQATIAAMVKEEPKSPSVTSHSQRGTNAKAGHQLQDFSSLQQVNTSVREHPTLRYPQTVRPKEKKMQHQTLSQESDSGPMKGSWCTDRCSDRAKKAGTVKEEPKSPSLTQHCYYQRQTNAEVGRQLQDYSTDVQNVPVSPKRNIVTPATIKEEPKSPFPIPEHFSQRATNSKSGSEPEDLYTDMQMNGLAMEHPQTPPLATVVRPKEKDREDQTSSLVKQGKPELQPKIQMKEVKVRVRAAETACKNVPDSTSTNTEKKDAAAESAANEDKKSSDETTEPDFSTHMTVKELAQMFSASTAPQTAFRPKKYHREEPKLSQGKRQIQTFSTASVQKTAGPPKEKDREDQNLLQVPDRRSHVDQINAATAEATEDPKSSCESAQLSHLATGIKVRDLARMFSANATQETAAQPKKKHREETNLSEMRLTSVRAIETTVQKKDKEKPELTQNTVQPCQSSLDAVWLEINSVFSEVMKVVEDAKQKSLVLPLSSLRTTIITTKQQIHQKLDKLASVELKCISKFAVDVKLDQTTAHCCLVSADGMEVRGKNQETRDAPGTFGNILGLNSLMTGMFYWEVEVSNKTGWGLGVARGYGNSKRNLSVNPDNGFWVTVYYENKEYAALTAPPVPLSLKEKPKKVGVFVNYEKGLVSFYNVTAQSHIYSFTECSFTGEIFPYFSVHPKQDGSYADPLIISPVKHH